MRMLALKTVLAATDLDQESLTTVAAGRALARSAGAALHVVHVGTAAPEEGQATHAQLARLGIRLDEATVHTVPGEAAAEIVDLAREISADVIVVGRHRGATPGGDGTASTALQIATDSPVPCLVVGHPPHVPVRRVVVAIDGSETAQGAMTVALSWTSGLRASRVRQGTTTLVALHVDDASNDGAEHELVAERVDKEIARLRESAGTWAAVDIELVVVRGRDVPGAIVAYLEKTQADFVVLGTRGAGLDEHQRLGSVSAAVTLRTTVPVLLVPPYVWRNVTAEA